MKIHRIVDRTFFDMKTNVYLIEAKNPVLVDSGYKALAKIQKEIDNITGELSAIILTHNHPDHAGCAYKLSEIYDCPIYIHESELPRPNFPTEKLGKSIALGGSEELQVIRTPGHTRGGICLYDPVTGALFSGDTIFAKGNVGRFDLRGGSYSELVNSIRKLKELEVSAIYPGHDEIVTENAKKAIEKAYKNILQFKPELAEKGNP